MLRIACHTAALAGAERGARGVWSQRQGRACSAALAKSPESDPRTHDRARLGLRLGKQALLHIHLSYGASGSRCALGSYNTLDPCIAIYNMPLILVNAKTRRRSIK